MHKITNQDYEALIYVLEQNCKSSTSDKDGWYKITYKDLTNEVYSYPERVKRLLGDLVTNRRIEISDGKSLFYRVLVKSEMLEEQFHHYQEYVIKIKEQKTRRMAWADLLYNADEQAEQEKKTIQRKWRASDTMQYRKTGAGTTFIFGGGNDLSVHESFMQAKEHAEYRPAGESTGKNHPRQNLCDLQLW